MLDKLTSVGYFLMSAGALSIVLNLINFNLRILLWIDNWGTTTGWIIRVGLVVGGGILYLVGTKFQKKEG